MKNKTLRGLLRLAAFGLCFVPVLLFANTFLIKTDTYARLTLAEMKQRSDIDMVFVGSSIVRDHFNAEMITKETGLESFSLGIPCAALQADLAMTKEFYRTNHPEWTVLVVEPFTFDTVKEGIEAQYELMPYLSSPRRARQILSEPLPGGRMVSGQAVHVPRLRRRFVFGFHEDRRPAFLAV